jgi:hypothetical protein
VWNLKYFGSELRNKDCGIKKLRGNQFAVMLLQLENVLLSFLLSETMTIEM